MAFQPVNYAGIAPMGISGIGQGMQMGMAPFQEIRKAKSDQLVDALNQLKLEYLPQEFQSQFALRDAQAQKAQQGASKQKMLSALLQQRLGAGGQVTEGAGGDELGEILFRKLAGLPEETPGEKQRRELSTFKQKETFKNEQDVDQNIGSQIEAVIPRLHKLKSMNVPGQMVGDWFNPNLQADYESMLTGVVEPIFSIAKLNKTDTTYKDVKKKFARRRRESEANYRKRIGEEIIDLADTYRSKTGKDLPESLKEFLPSQNMQNMGNDPLGLR